MTAPADIEPLIRAVTEQVLARLNASRGEAPRERRLVLLLPLPSRQLPVLAAQAETLLRRGRKVTVLAGQQALAMLGELSLREKFGPEVLQLEDGGLGTLGVLSKRDAVVLGSLGFELVRDLVDLADGEPIVRFVTQALLLGNPVYALSEDLEPEGAAGSSRVVAEGAKALRDLAGLGLSLLRAEELGSLLERLEGKEGTLTRQAGTLLTESEVERLFAAGERRLQLDRQTVVTPLARSRAAALGLELIGE